MDARLSPIVPINWNDWPLGLRVEYFSPSQHGWTPGVIVGRGWEGGLWTVTVSFPKNHVFRLVLMDPLLCPLCVLRCSAVGLILFLSVFLSSFSSALSVLLCSAAWVPVSVTTRKDGSKGVMPHFIDRAKPGVIAVLRDGKRFANEGNSYHDFVQAMIRAAKPGEEIAAYLVCDHETLRKYGLGCVPPRPMPLGHHLKTGYLKRGATLSELAAQAGIDAGAFGATVA